MHPPEPWTVLRLCRQILSKMPANPAPEVTVTEQTARPLDEVDRAMLRVLCDDGRVSMLELANRLGISRGNAYARFERLRRDGVLAGFTARVDTRRLGLTVAAFVNVRIEQQSWQTIRKQLLAIDEVEYAALTTGGSDFVVLVRAASVETLRDVVLERLRQVPGVRTTFTTLILDEHPKQTVLPP
jgi:DNA-binding Lrp family transcriptional regulator